MLSTAMDSDEAGASPSTSDRLHNNPYDHALSLLRPLSPLIMDFSHRCLTWSLFTFGRGLLDNGGYMRSLAMAGSAAGAYAMSGTIFSVLEAVVGKLGGEEEEEYCCCNVAAAGFCLGLIKSSFLGSKTHHLLNGILWAAAGVVDYNTLHFIRHRLPYQKNPEYPMPVFPERTLPDPTMVSFMKIVAQNVILTSSIGIIMGCVLHSEEKSLIACFGDASPLTKFCSITGGILAHSFLLLRELKGKDDGIDGGLIGCASALFEPQAYGTPNILLLRCLGAGAIFASIRETISLRPFLLHFPPKEMQSCAEAILPPFTLPLSKNIEDGFSFYYESLIKHIKK